MQLKSIFVTEPIVSLYILLFIYQLKRPNA